jgi:hypothetical protein
MRIARPRKTVMPMLPWKMLATMCHSITTSLGLRKRRGPGASFAAEMAMQEGRTLPFLRRMVIAYFLFWKICVE